MKTNIKMKVNPEQSKKVQEICFEIGMEWTYGGKEISNLNMKYLCIETLNRKTRMYYIDETKRYRENNNVEVDADLFIRTNGTCEACEEVFYDCNFPDEKDGYNIIELSDDIYQYKKIVNITRVEVIGKNGREFTKLLKDGHYELSLQDDGKTIKIFEK